MLIKEFFKNQEIFITGGSGFIGKALIEKLLRSCPDISKIFVLLRGKKGKSANERLHEILQTKLFDRARQEQPDAFEKVEAIAGDCAELGLSVSAEDLKKLQNVSIIYHAAASVRFDDPLKHAVLLNTRGTREILELAKTLKNLKVFVHVSTTYCSSDRTILGEKVYKPCADWRETIKLAETLDEETLNIFFLKYSEFMPNTYTFTKTLGEDIVNSYKDKLPVLIFRPSIVVSCIDDPIPGWIDNFNGPIGMLVGCGTGLLRGYVHDGSKLIAVVPVDVVIRSLIISTYKKGIETKKSSKFEHALDVYNCAIDRISPIKLVDLIAIGRRRVRDNPFEMTLWYPGGTTTNCPVLFLAKVYAVQIPMALIADILLRLNGKKPMVLKLLRRMHQAIKATKGFSKRQWHFEVDEFFALENLVPKTEYDDFAFLEKSHLNYEEYFNVGIRGAKEFLLKESPDSSPGAQKRLQILKILHYGMIVIFYILFGSFFVNWIYNKVFENAG